MGELFEDWESKKVRLHTCPPWLPDREAVCVHTFNIHVPTFAKTQLSIWLFQNVYVNHTYMNRINLLSSIEDIHTLFQ